MFSGKREKNFAFVIPQEFSEITVPFETLFLVCLSEQGKQIHWKNTL